MNGGISLGGYLCFCLFLYILALSLLLRYVLCCPCVQKEREIESIKAFSTPFERCCLLHSELLLCVTCEKFYVPLCELFYVQLSNMAVLLDLKFSRLISMVSQ